MGERLNFDGGIGHFLTDGGTGRREFCHPLSPHNGKTYLLGGSQHHTDLQLQLHVATLLKVNSATKR